MQLRLITYSILLILLNSCLKANDEAGIDPNANPFGAVTSAAVQEAYILQIDDWNLTADGKSFFEHLLQDDYFGLQVFSSSENPIRNLTVQLGHDVENFLNLLNVNGIFDPGQSLRMRLPASLFDLISLNLINSIDYDSYKYEFVANGSTSRTTIAYEVDADGVFVELSEFGTIVVSKLCSDGSTAQNGVCSSSSFSSITITGPHLDYDYYHDKRESLRTFTWDNIADATAECSFDAGATFQACDTNHSHTLTVEQFNAKVFFKVRLTVNGNEYVNGLDLSDPAGDHTNVQFYACNLTVSSGELTNVPFSALNTDDTVICFGNNAQIIQINQTAPSYLSIGASNLVFIGDHIERATLWNKLTSQGTAYFHNVFYGIASNAINPLFAHLILKKDDPTQGSVASFAGAHASRSLAKFVNVHATAASGVAISADTKNDLSFVDCEIISNSITPNGVVWLEGGNIQAYRSKITNTNPGPSGPAGIQLDGSETTSFSNIQDSVITGSNLAIQINMDGTQATPVKINIINSHLKSKTNGLSFYAKENTELHFIDTVFFSQSASVTGKVIEVSGSPTTNGDVNVNTVNTSYCRASTGGFQSLFNISGTAFNNYNSGSYEPIANLGSSCPTNDPF